MFSAKLTEELELLPLEHRHAGELFSLVDANREYLREWLPWVDSTITVDDTGRFIHSALQRIAENEAASALVCFQGRIAGSIGTHRIDWLHRKTEVGYWLAAPLQGRGLMTQACRAMIGHLFRDLALHRVEIHCAASNHRSRAIPERLGFVREGVLREAHQLSGRFVDLVIYGMIGPEWK